MKHSAKNWIASHWLILLIAAQPLLDALAFWTANERATVSGLIRLLLMCALPLWLLLRGRGRRLLLTGLGVMALYSLLHILNGYRMGYISPLYDIQYLVKVLQMPVLALCFMILIRDEETKDQAFRGLVLAGGITLALLVVSRITGTGNMTYGKGLGYSGWVIDSNRTANSILLVTLGTFATGWAIGSKRNWIRIAVPALVTAVYICNGTKACYVSIYGIFGAYALFLLLRGRLCSERPDRFMLIVLAALMLAATALYPVSPRHKVSAAIAKAASAGEIEATLALRGYDVEKLSFEERFNNPEVKEVFEHYYYIYFNDIIPDIFDRYGMDRVLAQFRMTTDAGVLINTRAIKLAYSALLWQQCDTPTRLVGFEVSELGFDGKRDLENDFPALFYYYGWIGCALYLGFLAYFLIRVWQRVREDLTGCLTLANCSLLLCLFLQLGLAQLSGALLRRPNVSFYLALVLALIAQAVRGGKKEETS